MLKCRGEMVSLGWWRTLTFSSKLLMAMFDAVATDASHAKNRNDSQTHLLRTINRLLDRSSLVQSSLSNGMPPTQTIQLFL